MMVIAADWGGRVTSLRQTPVQANRCTVTVFDVAVVEAVAGQGGAGGGDAAVLQQVETRGGGDGGRGAGAGGRVPLGERLHGREDQSQAVSHVLVGSTGQSWGVAWSRDETCTFFQTFESNITYVTLAKFYKLLQQKTFNQQWITILYVQGVAHSDEPKKNYHPVLHDPSVHAVVHTTVVALETIWWYLKHWILFLLCIFKTKKKNWKEKSIDKGLKGVSIPIDTILTLLIPTFHYLHASCSRQTASD